MDSIPYDRDIKVEGAKRQNSRKRYDGGADDGGGNTDSE